MPRQVPMRPLLPLFALLVASTAAFAQESEAESPLTLEEAHRLALERSPRFTSLRSTVQLQEADLTAARVFPTNPALELSTGPRVEADVVGLDATIGVSQALPVFGRYGAAIDVQEAQLVAAKSELRFDTQGLLAGVSRAFIEAQQAAAILSLQQERTRLLQALVTLTQRRVEAGDATQLDVNLWQAELGSAVAVLQRAQARSLAARARLASLVGLDPMRPPVPAGSLTPPARSELRPFDVGDRGDLIALEARVQAATEATELAEARAWPDVAVGAYVGTERLAPGPSTVQGEYFAGAQLAVDLPIFNRNQGDIARANAQLARAKALRAAALLEAAAEVQAATARLEAALAAVAALESSVVGSLEETLTLLERSFEEGKIGMADLLLRQRTLLEARADYLDAVAEARLAEVDVELAAGRFSAALVDSDGEEAR